MWISTLPLGDELSRPHVLRQVSIVDSPTFAYAAASRLVSHGLDGVLLDVLVSSMFETIYLGAGCVKWFLRTNTNL